MRVQYRKARYKQYTHMCQAQQLLSADNLLRIQVEALEEVLVHLPVAQTSLDLQKRAERVEEVEDERFFWGGGVSCCSYNYTTAHSSEPHHCRCHCHPAAASPASA